MSKYVKNLITEHLRQRLQDVNDALLVNMVGLDANTNTRLRAELRGKNIHVMVVKNSMAARATEGTPLAAAVRAASSGTAAICWGSEDIVSLAKEITKLIKDDKFAPFEARGGVMDGEQLTAAAGRAGQQVAQPHRAVEHPARPDPQPGRDVGQPVELRRRRVGQPDRAEGRRRRASEAARSGRSEAEPRATAERRGDTPSRDEPMQRLNADICNLQIFDLQFIGNRAIFHQRS